MTLLTKVNNENINDNLKKRFENQEIYVRKTRERETGGRKLLLDELAGISTMRGIEKKT